MSTFQRAARPPGAPPAQPKRPASPTSPAASTGPKPRMRPRTVDRTRPPANPPVSAPADAGERLSKRVMQLKGCSRTEAEQYIAGGWVMVNGVVVEDPPFRVLQQTVTIDPDASLLKMVDVTLILNKPPGWLDGVEDPDDEDDEDKPVRQKSQQGRKPPAKNARSLLAADTHYAQDPMELKVLKRHFQHLEAEVPLETGASGLVVFTQDWRTTRKLSEDIGVMEHEYIAEVRGEVPPEALQKIERALKDERSRLPQVKFSVNSSTPEVSRLRFAIKGAHRGLIAFLCDKADLELTALRRIRLGRVALSDLPVGQWRYLGAHEKF